MGWLDSYDSWRRTHSADCSTRARTVRLLMSNCDIGGVVEGACSFSQRTYSEHDARSSALWHVAVMNVKGHSYNGSGPQRHDE